MVLEAVLGVLKASLLLFAEMSPYLLLGMFFVGILHIFVSKDFVARHVGKNNLASIIKAAIFGVPLPLCSCGVIPTAVYMKDNKASAPAVVSFLTATPQTGIDSIIATYGMLGPVFAIFRPIAALIMGILSGIGTIFFGDKSFPSTVKQDECKDTSCAITPTQESIPQKFRRGAKYAFVDFLDDIAPQFVVGLLLAGVISYLLPASFFENTSFSSGILGMLAMVVLGIPLYICATASIPIALSLMAKGVSAGAAYVFLVAGPATNAASLAVLAKTLGKKTTIVYTSSIIIFAIAAGYALNGIFYLLGESPTAALSTHIHQTDTISVTTLLQAVLFGGLILASLYRKYLSRFFKRKASKASVKLQIDSITCESCAQTISGALRKLGGVRGVSVNIKDNSVYIEGEVQKDSVLAAIDKTGYKVLSYQKIGENEEETKVKIKGMTCNHCVMNVEKALKSVSGVDMVTVSLNEKVAYLKGNFSIESLKKAIEKAGYGVED